MRVRATAVLAPAGAETKEASRSDATRFLKTLRFGRKPCVRNFLSIPLELLWGDNYPCLCDPAEITGVCFLHQNVGGEDRSTDELPALIVGEPVLP